ncbi:MAG: HEPN domain-containing protein [Actinobacteria bacterium]|nr:HEPN domain-containing protein [Actinomycetota bacterium]MBU4483060.1 HEPN domain-containing protein [Actinomycetota bacterium]MCG2791639.1 HEPN domain-containing protein [Actinomycetes bacterium]
MKKDTELTRKLNIIITKAKDTLIIAKQLYEQNYYNDSVSRAYYAVFHSLQAILLTLGLSFSKHSGVIGAFNKEFIHKDIFPKDFHKMTDLLFRDRQIGDYGYEENLSSDDAKQDIANAENIIEAIEKYLIKEGFLKNSSK